MTQSERQKDEKHRIQEFDNRAVNLINQEELELIPPSIANKVLEIYKEGEIIWSGNLIHTYTKNGRVFTIFKNNL